jgi:hypothetical protein
LTPAVLSKTNLKLVDNTKTKHMELSILFDWNSLWEMKKSATRITLKLTYLFRNVLLE